MTQDLRSMSLDQLLKFLSDYVLESRYGYNLQVDFNKEHQKWIVEITGLCKIEENDLQVALRWAAENAKLKRDEPQFQYRK